MRFGGVRANTVDDECEEWVELAKKTVPDNGNAECESHTFATWTGVDKGESLELLLVRFSKDRLSVMDARYLAVKLSNRVEITIGYESVFFGLIK
jgi:hypothetical protein